MRPHTDQTPKPLLPVGGQPILDLMIRRLALGGVRRLTIAVCHLARQVEERIGDGSRYGMRIDYFHEEKPLGTAGSLALIPDLSSPFLVLNGDILTDLDFSELAAFHERSKAVLTIATQKRIQRIDFGAVELNGDHLVKSFREKPEVEYLASLGISMADPRVVERIPRGEPMDLPELVGALIGQNERVSAFPFDGYWRDLGSPREYELANEDLESRKVVLSRP